MNITAFRNFCDENGSRGEYLHPVLSRMGTFFALGFLYFSLRLSLLGLYTAVGSRIVIV
jgi:hypothetical protein